MPKINRKCNNKVLFKQESKLYSRKIASQKIFPLPLGKLLLFAEKNVQFILDHINTHTRAPTDTHTHTHTHTHTQTNTHTH